MASAPLPALQNPSSRQRTPHRGELVAQDEIRHADPLADIQCSGGTHSIDLRRSGI